MSHEELGGQPPKNFGIEHLAEPTAATLETFNATFRV